MNEKKLKLIDKGLSLFAEKGYHSTSIQEIATEAGISKGAFYLYFQSKEDFVVTAIEYIHEKITTQLAKVKRETSEPKEAVAKQIASLIEYIDEYKSFITMYISESISIGERMDALIRKMEAKNYNWIKDIMKILYKEEIGDLLFDAMIQFEGMINGYIKWMVVYNIKVDATQASEFIVRRLDNLVKGMMNANETPLISKAHFKHVTSYGKQNTEAIINSLEEKVKHLPVNQEKEKQLLEVVETLKTEKNGAHIKPILLQGLLAHFGPYPVLHEEAEHLANVWDIELL